MKPGRTAALVITAIALPGLAACSGTSSGSSPVSPSSSDAAGTSSPAQSPASSQPPAQGQTGGSGSLTPPGTHLALGGPATVGWVPPSQDLGTGAHKGIKLQVTVVSIQKGTMADFRNVELNGNQRNSTPYYVQLRVTALSSASVPKDSDPAITFTAIDDRRESMGRMGYEVRHCHLPRENKGDRTCAESQQHKQPAKELQNAGYADHREG